MMRQKILREPNGYGYPILVCDRCGTAAAENYRKEIQSIIDGSLGHCGICQLFTNVSSPSDYGWPAFYTYLDGTPVK
jgi:hypothetical protein